MEKVKKGLTLVLIGVALVIVGGIMNIVAAFISQNAGNTVIGIANIIALVAFVLELIGFIKAGKGNKHFHLASLMMIVSIIIVVTCIILSFVGANNNIPGLIVAVSWISFGLTIWNLFIIFNVIQGCKDVAPVGKLATVIFVMYFFNVAFAVFNACTATVAFPEGVQQALGIIAIILGVVGLVAQVLYIILLIRTRAEIGTKPVAKK